MLDVIILCFINLLSFVIGAKIGQGKNITLNPIKAVKESITEKKEKKIADLKDRQLKTTLENIDNYDGSGFGQKEIPR